VETVIHSDSDFATVAYLRIKSAVLHRKSNATPAVFHVPTSLGERFAPVRDHIATLEVQEEPPSPMKYARSVPNQPSHVADNNTQSKKIGSWIAISNVYSNMDGESGRSIEEEVKQCFAVLQGSHPCFLLALSILVDYFSEELAQYSLELSDCTNINIFLSSMDLFSAVNAIYSTFFGTSPPSRACVAVDLPTPRRVMLDCIAHSRTMERHALHVQSLSYWAPANIGPYSQAIMVCGSSRRLWGGFNQPDTDRRSGLYLWSDRLNPV
jgi:diphthine-ammonia ligase